MGYRDWKKILLKNGEITEYEYYIANYMIDYALEPLGKDIEQ
jgi:hypothetical protein